MFSLEKHKGLLDEFKEEENRLVALHSELPEGWFLHKDFVERLKAAQNLLEQNLRRIKKSPFGKIESKINKQFDSVIAKFKNHIFLMRKQITKKKSGKIKNLGNNLRQSMALLIDDIHILIFYLQLYPLDKIRRKKAWKEILKGLQTGNYLPTYQEQEMKKIVEKFTDDELILALAFATDEQPLLLITMDRTTKKLATYIVKKGKQSEVYVISRLMGLLGIKRMYISQSKIIKDDKVEHINGIFPFSGIRLAEMPKLTDPTEILTFAYLLGAACADGYSLNLDDRLFNIMIDLREFKKSVRQGVEKFLGDKNPIFHIDYGFHTSKDPIVYLERQLFGDIGGLFVHLFIDYINLRTAKLKRETVAAQFNKGFSDELQRLASTFSRHYTQITSIFRKNDLNYLEGRFSHYNNVIMKKIQSEVLADIPVKEHKRAA